MLCLLWVCFVAFLRHLSLFFLLVLCNIPFPFSELFRVVRSHFVEISETFNFCVKILSNDLYLGGCCIKQLQKVRKVLRCALFYFFKKIQIFGLWSWASVQCSIHSMKCADLKSSSLGETCGQSGTAKTLNM